MSLQVSDRGSNKIELIEHAAEVLGRSKHKTSVFREIYKGKRAIKTVPELMTATGLPRTRVLDAGKKLESQDLIEQEKIDGVTGYRKIPFFQSHRDRILRLAKNYSARKRLITKRRPRQGVSFQKRIRIDIRTPKQAIKAKQITVDDVESFARVRAIRGTVGFTNISENNFKKGMAKILKERGEFNDWGGESRDLASTRLYLDGRRRTAAFAFKGPGKSGKLTPGKMGKNGDQIQRLLRCPADVFFVQYWSQIEDSVLEQLASLSELKSYFEGKEIWYGIIDGVDSTRLIKAYPKLFGSII